MKLVGQTIQTGQFVLSIFRFSNNDDIFSDLDEICVNIDRLNEVSLKEVWKTEKKNYLRE